MRLAVFAAAFVFTAWASQAHAEAPGATAKPGQIAERASASVNDERPDAQDLARWFYAVLAGEIAAHTGHPGTAYAELLKAARDLHSEALFQRAAEIALTAGAPQQALDAVNAWRADQPDSPKAQSWTAQLLVALGRNTEAVGAISRLIALTPQPQRPKTILSLAGLFARAGDGQVAVDLAKKALTPYEGIPQSSVVIGELYARAGSTNAAFAHASRALVAEPGMREAAELVLQTYTADPGQADQLLAQYVAAKPQDADLRMAWIQAALGQQRDGIALAQTEALSKVKPDVPDVWLVLGSLQLRQDQPVQAQGALLRYLSLIGESKPAAPPAALERAYVALSDAALQQGDYPQAERWLENIPTGQRTLVTILQQATILVRQGKLESGLSLLDKLPAGTAQQQREKLLARAQLYRTAKQYGKAYAVLASALPQFGAQPDYAYETAMMAEKSGRPHEMQRMLRKLIADHPQYQPAYNALGYTLADEGRQLPEAMKLIARALKLSPGNPFVLDSLGWAQFRMGDLKQAAATLEAAFAARPDPEIAAHLAEVLWQRGDKARARAILRQAFERAPQDGGVQAAMQRMGVRF